MGWAARLNKAAKVKALQDGTLNDQVTSGIMSRMRPNPMPRHLASMLMMAQLMSAHRVTRRPSPTGRLR